ncbi:MAG: aminopeptidase [Deinococcales bacterium]
MDQSGSAYSRALQEANKEKLQSDGQAFAGGAKLSGPNTRWCGTLFPMARLGMQDAGMSLSAYDFVYGAMFYFADDPVAKWQEIYDFQAKLIERLSKADEVHILAEGTDLKMRLKDRTWVNSDGKRNMPSGEVFSSPVRIALRVISLLVFLAVSMALKLKCFLAL